MDAIYFFLGIAIMFLITAGIMYLLYSLLYKSEEFKNRHKYDYNRERDVEPHKTKNYSDVKYNIKKWSSDVGNYFNSCNSLKGLIRNKPLKNIYYGDLLGCVEWQFKRLQILIRDRYSCKQCGIRDIRNHVHHKYYIKDCAPWDIAGEALQTLCRECHTELHRNFDVPIYKKQNGILIKDSAKYMWCERCEGTGYIHEYSHVQNGICFLCWGDLSNMNIFLKMLRRYSLNFDSIQDTQIRQEYKSFLSNIDEDSFYDFYPESNYYLLGSN